MLFLSFYKEWNSLDNSVSNSESFFIFNKNILEFIRPSPNSIFTCHNLQGKTLLTRLRLSLSHPRNHRFKQNFQDSLNPICNSGADVETTSHYLLHCPLFSDDRLVLINNIWNIDNNISNLNDSSFSEVFIFGKSSVNNTKMHRFRIPQRNISSHLRDLMSLFWLLISLANTHIHYIALFTSIIFFRFFNFLFSLGCYLLLST